MEGDGGEVLFGSRGCMCAITTMQILEANKEADENPFSTTIQVVISVNF